MQNKNNTFGYVSNLTNFFALPGIRTQTDHLQGGD